MVALTLLSKMKLVKKFPSLQQQKSNLVLRSGRLIDV